MLQAALRYETTVLPRVKKVLAIPEAATTNRFLGILTIEGEANLLNWRDPEKPNRILAITHFFISEGVETVVDLRAWLSQAIDIPRLKQQCGIGDNNTADYFKILAGIQSTSIDRHLFRFLVEAGCPAKDYVDAQQMIQAVADKLSIPYSILDHNIRQQMSSKK